MRKPDFEQENYAEWEVEDVLIGASRSPGRDSVIQIAVGDEFSNFADLTLESAIEIRDCINAAIQYSKGQK